LPSSSAGSVQSLERGLAVIRCFDADHAQLTLSEVARRTDLSRATARRLLHTLAGLGYVAVVGRDFSLRPRILELGYAYVSSLGLPAVAQPHLEEFHERVHESCSVAVLDEHDVVYVARVAAQRLMTVAIHVGTRFPAHLTSMGRVLLANLEPEQLEEHLAGIVLEPVTPRTITDPEKLRKELRRVSRRGWALVDQELEMGLRSIAAPLHDRGGQVVAALNVSASARRGTPAQIEAELLPELLQTARAIEHDLSLVRV
jgi:IclR family transcriptional regulator, pca regulon regulatory protein